MSFRDKWWPVVALFVAIAFAWFLIFWVGLVPAYSRDVLDVGVPLDFGH